MLHYLVQFKFKSQLCQLSKILKEIQFSSHVTKHDVNYRNDGTTVQLAINYILVISICAALSKGQVCLQEQFYIQLGITLISNIEANIERPAYIQYSNGNPHIM